MCLFQNFINLKTIFHHSPFNVSVNIHDSFSENPLEVRYFNININVKDININVKLIKYRIQT